MPEPKSHVDLLILGALHREPAHGYGLVESIRERSGGVFELAEGTVYPALYRLERQGFVESEWQKGHARRRRVYRLTERGASQLLLDRDGWSNRVRAMRAVLG